MTEITALIDKCKYPIFIERDLKKHLSDYLSSISVNRNILIVTDDFLLHTYAQSLQNILVSQGYKVETYIMRGGKVSKSFSEVLKICKEANILNIELGSNHVYERNFKKIIKKYKFNYLIHNYFPVPKKSFVVNIASAKKNIRILSIKHIKKAILFCKSTKSSLYTFHPGFVGDPKGPSRSKKNYDFIWEKKILNSNYNLAFYRMISSLKKISSI